MIQQVDRGDSGFTLVETMITLVMSLVVMGAIFGAYQSQQKSSVVQDGVAEMQQNGRAAFLYIINDIRQAVADPTRNGIVGVRTAEPGLFVFSTDLTGNVLTDPNPNEANGIIEDAENISYGFSTSFDVNRNGIADGGTLDWGEPGELGKGRGLSPTVFSPIADYVEAVEFNYVLDDGSTSSSVSGAKMNRIEAVQISLLIRSSKIDPQYTNTKIYTTYANTDWGPFNDNYRRHLAMVNIKIRNRTL